MIYVLILIILIFIISAIYCHFNITITKYKLKSDKVEDKIKILQLSDLHNRSFGKNSCRLIKKIDLVAPDIIVITGDLFDTNEKGITKMINLMEIVSSKYKCYFVMGNHELYINPNTMHKIMEKFKSFNINVLQNECIDLDDNITLYGIGYNLITKTNGSFEYKTKETLKAEQIEQKIGKLNIKKYNILLAHTPFSFEAYSDMDFDLVFSGHVHGGIIRIPGIGGILSPQRRFFPKYSEGIYERKNTKMVVSRGLGYGHLKIRAFNTPEIVVVDIEK